LKVGKTSHSPYLNFRGTEVIIHLEGIGDGKRACNYYKKVSDINVLKLSIKFEDEY
jgi:hypothetical protein